MTQPPYSQSMAWEEPRKAAHGSILACALLIGVGGLAGCGSTGSTPSASVPQVSSAQEAATQTSAEEETAKEQAKEEKENHDDQVKTERSEAKERRVQEEYGRAVTHLLRERAAIGMPQAAVVHALGKPDNEQESEPGEAYLYYKQGSTEYQVVIEHGVVARINREGG